MKVSKIGFLNSILVLTRCFSTSGRWPFFLVVMREKRSLRSWNQLFGQLRRKAVLAFSVAV
jgi:hypothetical protein